MSQRLPRLVLAAAGVALVAVLSGAASARPPASALGNYASGKALFEAGQYRDALNLFQAAWRQVQNDALRYYLGRCHAALDECSEALPYLTATRHTVRASNPARQKELYAARNEDESKCRLLLADQRMAEERWDEAERVLRDGLAHRSVPEHQTRLVEVEVGRNGCEYAVVRCPDAIDSWCGLLARACRDVPPRKALTGAGRLAWVRRGIAIFAQASVTGEAATAKRLEPMAGEDPRVWRAVAEGYSRAGQCGEYARSARQAARAGIDVQSDACAPDESMVPREDGLTVQRAWGWSTLGLGVAALIASIPLTVLYSDLDGSSVVGSAAKAAAEADGRAYSGAAIGLGAFGAAALATGITLLLFPED